MFLLERYNAWLRRTPVSSQMLWVSGKEDKRRIFWNIYGCTTVPGGLQRLAALSPAWLLVICDFAYNWGMGNTWYRHAAGTHVKTAQSLINQEDYAKDAGLGDFS